MKNEQNAKIEDTPNLPDKFTKGEYSTASGVFEKHKESDKAFIYKRTDENVVYWEVFLRKEEEQFGRKYTPYPSDRAFGHWAWCYNNYEKALRHFNHLNTRTKQQDLKPPNNG